MKQESKNYYKILEVSENAQPEEIKRAFRSLAIQYHPDRNSGDPKSEEQFKAITEAYGVLIDPQKRKKYDLFRATSQSGNRPDSSGFRYSQEDIFKDIFNNIHYRKIFQELNQEFNESGFRSGPGFFQNMFFRGGGLTRLLWLIPGPFARIGNILRLIQIIGSSLIFLNQIVSPRHKSDKGKNEFSNKFKNFFKKKEISSTTLDIAMLINIPTSEAATGTQKKITYKINEIPESLVVKIPQGIRSGQTLRIREKGKRQAGKRGDLLLSVQVE